MNRRTWTRAAAVALTLLVTCLTTVTFARWPAAAAGTAGGRAAVVPTPERPTATTDPDGVVVTWAPVASTGYVVERTQQETGTTQPACGGAVVATATCVDTDVPAGTWTYRVRARLGSWRGPSSPASAGVVVTGASDATLDLAPRAATPGDDVTVTGTGWPAGSEVAVTFGGAPLCTVRSGADGAVSRTCTVPARSAGRYAVRAASGPEAAGFGELTVVPGLRSVSPAVSPGGQLAVLARGFAGNGQVDIWLGDRALGVRAVPQDGEIAMTLPVPADLAVGEHTLRVADRAGNEATAPVTIAAPSIQVTPSSAAAGDTVQVTGVGWSPGGAQVRVNLPNTSLCLLTPDEHGAVAGSCRLPDTPGGQVQVAATDGTSIAHAQLRVTSSVSAGAAVTSIGASLTLTGRGFGAGSVGQVSIDGTVVATTGEARGTSNGTLTATVVVPALDTGTYDVRLSDAAGNSATTSVRVVAPELTLEQGSGTAQSVVKVSGRHWPANVGVSVKFDGLTGCTQVSGADGSFGQSACNVPLLAGGPHTVTASGGATVLRTPLTFTITPKASIDHRTVAPGQTTTVRGSGLPAGTDVRFLIGDVEVATVRTASDGTAAKAIVVPDLPAGDTTVRVVGALGAAEAPVTVVRPTVQIDTTTIVPTKTAIRFTGSGWPANQLVSIQIGGQSACSAYAVGDRLDFTCTPQALPGGAGQVVTASTGAITATAGSTVTVEPRAWLNVTSAVPGYSVYAIARGLYTGREVELLVNGTLVEKRQAPSDGTWQRVYTIPAGTPPGTLEFVFRQPGAPQLSVTMTVLAP